MKRNERRRNYLIRSYIIMCIRFLLLPGPSEVKPLLWSTDPSLSPFLDIDPLFVAARLVLDETGETFRSQGVEGKKERNGEKMEIRKQVGK